MSKRNKTLDLDMLHGSIGDKTLKFALPLAATGILQQLFTAADTAIIGRFAGTAAQAAVGCNVQTTSLLYNTIIGISVGVNVIVAGCIGRDDKEAIRKSVHTSILFAFLSGIFITIFSEIIGGWLLHAMSVPDKIFDMALLYLRIFLFGAPFIFLYNFESAILRSKGNTRTPLFWLFVSGIVNVILNVILVACFDLGVAGVAIATVLSNILSSVALFVSLMRQNDATKLVLRDLSIDLKTLKEIFRIGLPAGLQNMAFNFANVCIQSGINKLGPVVIAASSASIIFETMAYNITSSFGSACTTFVSQNHAAGDDGRCRRSIRWTLLQGGTSILIFSGLMLIFGRGIFTLFNPDTAVVSKAFLRTSYVMPAQIISLTMDILSGSIRGFGDSSTPAITIMFTVCGVRILWILTVFKHFETFVSLLLVYPISWAVTTAILFVIYLRQKRKLQGR
ncbi:MAG: MATE family efflux transporter [Clostridiales bacterium]|nr:MATE family efflux transporter [Clostridiales bacterium]